MCSMRGASSRARSRGRLAGKLQPEQLATLRQLVEDEDRATRSQDKHEAIRLSGEFHLQLARLCGNPIFVRMLEELLPTTSLLMALYKAPGQPMCVAHSHQRLLSVLTDSRSAPARPPRCGAISTRSSALCTPGVAQDGGRCGMCSRRTRLRPEMNPLMQTLERDQAGGAFCSVHVPRRRHAADASSFTSLRRTPHRPDLPPFWSCDECMRTSHAKDAGWLTERSKGGGSGAARAGGHERSRPPGGLGVRSAPTLREQLT
jgi:hypothetical protein